MYVLVPRSAIFVKKTRDVKAFLHRIVKKNRAPKKMSNLGIYRHL